MEFEKVKAYLSKHVDDSGTSIYSHIAAISRKVVEEKPENAYERFENLSLEIKKEKTNIDKNNDIPKILVDEEERQEIKRSVDSILMSYGRKSVQDKERDEDEENEEEKEEIEAIQETIDITKCPNILKNQQLLLWSGISINNEEAYQLQHAFNRLICKFKNIENSRFWGKIEAMNNDYYIVEAKLSQYPEKSENTSQETEDPGKYSNEFVYFVTQNIENGEWIKLNDVTPQQIKQSRQIYRLFTGNLNANVCGRIPFKWTEAELLRAQISRISSTTILAPSEYYQKTEKEDNNDQEEENPFLIELNEEFVANEGGGTSQQVWVHERGDLRLDGRLTKWIETENDQEQKESQEEEIPILQQITNDKCSEFSYNSDEESSESSNCWYIRQLNKNMPYKIVVINNKLWNGAKTIYLSHTKTFVNIYVGNGIKYRQNYYSPAPPLMIQSQFNEFKEIEIQNEENQENQENKQEAMIQQQPVFLAQKEELPPKQDENAYDENNQDENADKELEKE